VFNAENRGSQPGVHVALGVHLGLATEGKNVIYFQILCIYHWILFSRTITFI